MNKKQKASDFTKMLAGLNPTTENAQNKDNHEPPIKSRKFKEMGPEGSQKAINDYLSVQESLGNLWYSNVDMQGTFREGKYMASTSHKKNGFPDNVVIIRGVFYAVEVKSSTGRQSKDQKVVEKGVLDNGGNYLLVRTTGFLHNKLFGEAKDKLPF